MADAPAVAAEPAPRERQGQPEVAGTQDDPELTMAGEWQYLVGPFSAHTCCVPFVTPLCVRRAGEAPRDHHLEGEEDDWEHWLQREQIHLFQAQGLCNHA